MVSVQIRIKMPLQEDGGSAGKESACNAGDLGLILGLGGCPGEGNTHSSILAWRIPWTVWSMGSQKFRHDWATCTFQEDELEKEAFLTNLQANSFQPVLPLLGTDDGTKMALVQAGAGLCWVKPLGSPQLDSSVWDTVFPATVMACILASAGKASPCSLSCPELCFCPNFPQTSWVLSEQFVQSSRTAHSTCQLGFFLINREFAERKDTWNIFFFQLQHNVCIYIVRFTTGGVCETILHDIRLNFKTLLGDLGLIPGLGRSPGGEYGYPLQYSGLENSMD